MCLQTLVIVTSLEVRTWKNVPVKWFTLESWAPYNLSGTLQTSKHNQIWKDLLIRVIIGMQPWIIQTSLRFRLYVLILSIQRILCVYAWNVLYRYFNLRHHWQGFVLVLLILNVLLLSIEQHGLSYFNIHRS